MDQAHTCADPISRFVSGAVPVDLADNAETYQGEGLYSRRLTDKILSAFNQAYATGEFAIADLLRVALTKAIGNAKTVGGDRKGHQTLTQADLWVRFVDARNAFRSVNDPLSDASTTAVDTALERMREAYRCWSVS